MIHRAWFNYRRVNKPQKTKRTVQCIHFEQSSGDKQKLSINVGDWGVGEFRLRNRGNWIPTAVIFETAIELVSVCVDHLNPKLHAVMIRQDGVVTMCEFEVIGDGGVSFEYKP
jgi:hypothetical protein